MPALGLFLESNCSRLPVVPVARRHGCLHVRTNTSDDPILRHVGRVVHVFQPGPVVMNPARSIVEVEVDSNAAQFLRAEFLASRHRAVLGTRLFSSARRVLVLER